MDIEFLVTSLNPNQEAQSTTRPTQFDEAIQQANLIGLLICVLYMIKLAISLIFWNDIENPLFLYFATLIGVHDVIAVCHFAVFNATSYGVKYSQITDMESPSIFKLGTSLILLFLQEIWSQFKPLNGLVILYAIQQKLFKKNMIFLKCLYYLNSIYFLYILIAANQDKPVLTTFHLTIFLIQWLITILLFITYSVIYVIGRIKDKEYEFQFQKNILNIIADKIQETSFKNMKKDTNLECAICFQEFLESDTIIQLPCHQNHFFHSQCCKQWLMKDNRCPLCRVHVEN